MESAHRHAVDDPRIQSPGAALVADHLPESLLRLHSGASAGNRNPVFEGNFRGHERETIFRIFGAVTLLETSPWQTVCIVVRKVRTLFHLDPGDPLTVSIGIYAAFSSVQGHLTTVGRWMGDLTHCMGVEGDETPRTT